MVGCYSCVTKSTSTIEMKQPIPITSSTLSSLASLLPTQLVLTGKNCAAVSTSVLYRWHYQTSRGESCCYLFKRWLWLLGEDLPSLRSRVAPVLSKLCFWVFCCYVGCCLYLLFMAHTCRQMGSLLYLLLARVIFNWNLYCFMNCSTGTGTIC